MDPVNALLIGSLALVRITAMIFTAPVLGHRAVPFRLRILLAITITATTFPLISAPAAVDMDANRWLTALLSEVVVGIMLGLGVMIVFAAAEMAGTLISQMASLQLSTENPAGSSPVGSFFGILSLAAFTLMNGPEMLIGATLETFVQLPIGATLETNQASNLLVELLRQSFLLTLRGVAPAVVAMMISTLVIGLISRNYPQINLLNLGLNSNLAVMLLAIFFTVGGCVWLFVDDFGAILQTIQTAISNSSTSDLSTSVSGSDVSLGLAP